MYRDKPLIPSDVVRLAVLGTLQLAPRNHADLAREVRGFIARIVGDQLELMGSPIEVLRLEGRIETDDDDANTEAPILCQTEAGRATLQDLLRSSVEPPIDQLTKLTIALKLRHLAALDAEEQREQADMLVELCEMERARIADLRAQPGNDSGPFGDWLSHDIAELDARLAWFQALHDRL